MSVEKEQGLVRRLEGSKAEESALGGQEAYEFLLALPQHRTGNLGVAEDAVMLEQDGFALPEPVPDKGAAQVEDALFALFLKGPLGNIASRPFSPEVDDALPQPFYEIPPFPFSDKSFSLPRREGRKGRRKLLDGLLSHLPDNDPVRPPWLAATG